MNRNLVIGGVVAAVLHGGALLVFPRGPVPTAPEPEYLIKPEPFPLPADVEPPDPVMIDGSDAKKEESIPPPPSSDELLVKDPGPFITEQTSMPRLAPDRDSKLPTMPVGLAPTGTGDAVTGIFAGVDLDNRRGRGRRRRQFIRGRRAPRNSMGKSWWSLPSTRPDG